MLSEIQAKSFSYTGVLVVPDLFAFDEIAWLRDEAVAAALRHGATPDGGVFLPTSIRDLHRCEPGFRKLAHHPRLVELARSLLGGDVAIRETRLTVQSRFDLAAARPSELQAVIFLDHTPRRPDGGVGGRLGSVLFVGAEARYGAMRDDPALVFVVVFTRATHGQAGISDDADDEPLLRPVSPEPDDCLWPSPYCAFG